MIGTSPDRDIDSCVIQGYGIKQSSPRTHHCAATLNMGADKTITDAAHGRSGPNRIGDAGAQRAIRGSCMRPL